MKHTSDPKTSDKNRLIIVSNRLPTVLSKNAKGTFSIQPGAGGLVTALAPVLRNRGGIWIGWPGTVVEEYQEASIEKLMEQAGTKAGYELRMVHLSADEVEKYYRGFSNEIMWPLFHDLQGHCNFDPEYWYTYQSVNRKFAEVVARDAKKSDFIWIHDYHLIGVGTELRKLGVTSQIGFFLHTPFPPLDMFLRLPWRFQLLNALLEYNLLGFQTIRDRRNFWQCLQTLLGYKRGPGKGQVSSLRVNEHSLRVGAFPISIDFNEFAEMAQSQEVANSAWYIHENLPNQQIVLGVDRLDYSKGIPERLKAFENALTRFPELRENISLVQIVVPSRREIPKYADLKRHIERLVGEINGRFTRSGWVPIHYLFRSLDRVELISYYRTSEIALITPLKDGMNLIAKEYCASNIDGNGVLILSEFAGAAAQLQKGALLVNPHDIERVAEAIHEAFHMKKGERKKRMQKLRAAVKKDDIFKWVDQFLDAALAKNLRNFPVIEDFIPQEEEEER